MARCDKCLHGDVCFTILDSMQCQHFKDSSRFVELPCKLGDSIYEPKRHQITEYQIVRIVFMISDYGWSLD